MYVIRPPVLTASRAVGECRSIGTQVISVPPVSVTRRQLLKSGGIAAVAAATAAWPQREPGVFGLSAPGHLRRSAYLPLVGEDLRLGRAGRALELAAVEDLPGRGLAGREDAFALVLRGRSAPGLEQGTYTLRHETLGRFELFLVPAGPNRLRAVIDRSKRS